MEQDLASTYPVRLQKKGGADATTWLPELAAGLASVGPTGAAVKPARGHRPIAIVATSGSRMPLATPSSAIGAPASVDPASSAGGDITDGHRAILALQLLRPSRENLPG